MKYKWPDSKLETVYNPSEVMLYKTKIPSTPLAQLVVVDASSMSGIPLADFQTTQEFPAGIISDETMAAMPKTIWEREQYSSRASGVITKVTAVMPEDNIRAVYVNFGPVPAVLVGSANHSFRDMDVGNVLSISGHSSSDAFTVERSLDHHRLSYAMSALETRRRAEESKYTEAMATLRQTMVQQLTDGKIPEGVIGGYKVSNPRHEISYSDTVIVVPKEKFGMCLDYLNRNCKAGAVDVELMLRGLVGNPCRGVPVLVNGTSVTHDIRSSTNGSALHYINDHKIAHPDVDAVINSAVCYPGQQQAYDDFVETSSKVSLKFHRAVANGISWNLSGKYSVSAVDDDSEPKAKTPRLVDAGGKKIRMPEFMQKSDSNEMSCMVQFRKSAGKRCEAFLLGEWRKVRDFDILRRFLTETSSRGWVPGRWGRGVSLINVHAGRKGSKGEEYSDAPESEMEMGKDGKYKVKKPCRLRQDDESFVKLICRLDDCLLEPGWVIPGEHFVANTERTFRSREGKEYNMSATDTVSELVRGARRAVADMFKSSTNSMVDKLIRSRQLLDTIIKETEAEEFQEQGKWKFRVRGLSGNVYVVDEENASVHDNAGQHICIVRASAKFENAGYDYIASLLCILRDDRYTAKDVYTLKNRVGA